MDYCAESKNPETGHAVSRLSWPFEVGIDSINTVYAPMLRQKCFAAVVDRIVAFSVSFGGLSILDSSLGPGHDLCLGHDRHHGGLGVGEQQCYHWGHANDR